MASSSAPETLVPFYQKIYLQATQLSQRFLISFFVIGVALAFFHNTWALAFGLGGLSLAIYFGVAFLFPHHPVVRYVVSFLFGNFVLQFVLQMRGMDEMHFMYFIALTLLLFYENWKVLLPITLHSMASVTALYLLQVDGKMPEWLADAKPFTAVSFSFHVVMMLAYSAICVLWAVMQRRQTEESATTQLKMNEQISTMQINMSFADTISQGQLQAPYPADTPDDLGVALLNMQKSLREAASREEQEKFKTAGLAQTGEILRKHADNLDVLCDRVMEELVKYMKANQGFLFLIEHPGTPDEHLKLAASRAWDRKKFLQKRVEIGQGLVGQCAIERQMIYLTKIPQDYVTITSGLGQANPNSILLMPLQAEGQVVGVVELASFKEFTDTEKQFLEKVAESIAATIITTRNNQKNKELLEQSNMLAEQMKAQEEEIRQNLEEMQATQEEMARTQRELAVKAEEMEVREDNLNALINNTDDSILAMDRNYRVTIMNNALRARYKGTQYENLDVGADALAALGEVRDEWKEYYDRALAGEKMNFTIKSTVQGEDAFREYFINPMKSHHGLIVGLSVFSRDVTERHRERQQARKEIEKLMAQRN
jgi:methyl-accepting chemotaxis protein